MNLAEIIEKLKDPLRFNKFLWPAVDYYDREREVIYSAEQNDVTVVVAANATGKDFTLARVVVRFFLTRRPCRVVTTSAKDDHLDVLWGEMRQAIETARHPLDHKRGGPLLIKDREIEWVHKDGRVCPLSYIKGMVASQDSMAAMGGHHIAHTGDGIPRTMLAVDEASSVNDSYLKVAEPWAHRIVIIGNAWPCSNFFYHAVKGKPGTDDRGGDRPRPLSQEQIAVGMQPGANGYYRKVIRIRATDSPNVKLGLAQQAAGIEPTGAVLVPGVKDWYKYAKDLTELDAQEQAVKLRAEFYEGPELKLFPAQWLDRAESIALRERCLRAPAESIGCDPAEGGDKCAWAVLNRWGVKELVAWRTPDTNVIPRETLTLMRKHNLSGVHVVFDRGGGGKEHADRMRADGHGVRTVAFGEAPSLEPKRGMRFIEEKVEIREEHYAYVNMRAQMYGELSLAIDPAGGVHNGKEMIGGANGFSLPRECAAIREQLFPIPKLRDPEGRLKLPPKNKRDANDRTVTLMDLIGHSPDEADSIVIALYGMLHKKRQAVAGGM